MTRRVGEKRASKSRDELQGAGALASGLLLFAFLLQVVAVAPVTAHGGQAVPDAARPAESKHVYINLIEPNGGENWTAGTQEKFRWDWVHDSDPVNSIDLQLSLVGCLGDQDRIFYTVVKGHHSVAKDGQSEVYPWTVDPETPTSHQACMRILYYSPSAPGQNISADVFTIWNPNKPLSQIEVDLAPKDLKLPSGGKAKLVAKSGLTHRGIWFPIWEVYLNMSVSDGNLTNDKGMSGLDGHASFDYTAPKVTVQTNVTVKVCAELKWYRPSCFTSTISVIPPTQKVIFPEIEFDPDPPVGGTKTNVSVTVRNVTNLLPGAPVTVSASNGSIEPVTGPANETGVFVAVWTPPDITATKEMCITARAVYPGHPEEGKTTRCVDVVPRPIPKLSVVSYIEANGVLDSGTVRMHVVVTDSKGFVQGAFVNVVDPAGAVLDPASSGTTDDRGGFVADLRPPKLAANDTARTIALKINVTESEHQPVATQLLIDVYRDPGVLVRPSLGYYGAVGVVLSASLIFSVIGFLMGGAAAGGTLMADGGKDEPKGAKDPPPSKRPSGPARGPLGGKLPLARLLMVAGILLALVALGLATPAAENGLVDAGMKETVGGAPPQFNALSELAVVSTEVGITVIEIARNNRVITMVHTGFGAHDLEVDGTRDVLYVSNTRDGTVSAVDLGDPEFPILATMSVGRQPRHLALSGDGSRLWSVNDGDPSVSVIDTSRMIETARIPLAAPAGHGDIALVGGKAFVTSASGKLFRLDETSVQQEITVSKGAHEIELVGADTLFVGSKTSRAVDIVIASSGAVGNATAIPGNASFIAVTPSKKEVFVGLWDSASVARLDAATGALIDTFGTVEFPAACAFTPGGKYAYIGSGKNPSVYVNRLDNYSIADRLPIGPGNPSLNHPRALVASLNGFDLEFTASADGTAWWAFEPHLLSHAIHSGGAIGANPIDVVVL